MAQTKGIKPNSYENILLGELVRHGISIRSIIPLFLPMPSGSSSESLAGRTTKISRREDWADAASSLSNSAVSSHPMQASVMLWPSDLPPSLVQR
jgi:hypothetical protein